MKITNHINQRFRVIVIIGLGLVLAWPGLAQEDEECFMCHGEPDFEVTLEDGSARPLYVDESVFTKSIHGKIGCISCHMDIEEVPHKEKLATVDCGMCHSDEAELYGTSLHGQAFVKGDSLAPACWNCHGKHDMLRSLDPASSIHPVGILETCGACHAEDAPVAQSRNVSQHRILQNYKQSIHGEGILQKGLTVTAVCTSCHTAHHVLPHTNPESTIHRDNVVGTCRQCHALIEQVHRKVIDGKLWEADPDIIPICIDCHQPHEARKVYYDEGVSDRDCMFCHADEHQGAAGLLAAVNPEQLAASTHTSVRCAQCHTGANPSLLRPCETVAPAVDCSICHAEVVEQFSVGIHGKLLAKGDKDTPVCLDCHSGHGTQSKTDPLSPTFPRNVPNLCGRCHREGEAAATRVKSDQHDVIQNYTMSIHGKGLLESGLVVTATCSDCHSAHSPLPSSDPESSVHRDNIAETCGRCHHGIKELFESSIHSAEFNDTDKALPVCSGCHSAHSISRTDEAGFKLDVDRTCGRCHEEVMETYFETYHGKVSKLGSANAAKCHDCHGAHDVLPTTDQDSHLSRDNIVETCGKCHAGSHRRFAGYLTHATHHDPKKYPALFYTFWTMTLLLVGTFGFFGLHTLLWLPHSFRELRRGKVKTKAPKEEPAMFMRFDSIIRQMHFVLILSFFGLALTGMVLKFSYMTWAQSLTRVLGGFHAAGTIHRSCAVILSLVFAIHLGVIVHNKRKSGLTWLQLLFSSSSLLPQWHDAVEFVQTIKYFLHMGPRPKYGKWTYWEKFDYFAVFWGVAIIGSTGIILWFPEFCTHFLPGWFINVATIIHSDEALLAVGFIFTIHFFNTHFRPDKFPMDMVIFTGRVSVEELAHERPRYFQELQESGELEKGIVEGPVSRSFRFWAAMFGTIALCIGFSLVLFIIWSMIYGYK